MYDMQLNYSQLADALKERWSIGEASQFCDEFDWDPASREEIAEFLENEITKQENAWLDRIHNS